jgi:Flp pilus assembly pilin Flp
MMKVRLTNRRVAEPLKGEAQDPDRAVMTARAHLNDERGASMVEYALLVALIVVGTIASIQFLSDTSADYLEETGEDIGTPRERISDIDTDVPDPPGWLNN